MADETLTPSPRGGFSFLKAGMPYSSGAVALRGFEIVRARLAKPVSVADGFKAIDAHFRSVGRPSQALCAIELRSPKPFTFDGFREFNVGYVEYLKARDIHVNGINPVARTNVAPEIGPPAVPSLYGFSYTVPSPNAPVTFVVAGGGEWPEGSSDPATVIRKGETSPQAIREKARFVAGLMESRLLRMGVKWSDATATNVYTVYDIGPLLASEILPKMGASANHGVIWHYTRPPIVTIEFEMDVRHWRREVVI